MLAKLCNLFHDLEEDASHGAVILTDDAELQAVCSAFSLMTPPGYRVEHGSEAARVLTNEKLWVEINRNQLWDLLWSGAVVDFQTLTARAGVGDASYTRRLMNRLMGSRLVYPDGSISETAKDILNAITIREIKKASGQTQEGGGQA